MLLASRRRAVALGGGVVAVAALTAVTLATDSAEADTRCPDPGGEEIPISAEPEEGYFVFAGRGWGHGVGLSQYGAQGAALLGCTAEEILDVYYTDSQVAQVDPPGEGISVGIRPNTPSASHAQRYRVDNSGTAGVPWQVRDDEGEVAGTLTMPAGAVWRIDREDDEFTVQARDGDEWHDLDWDSLDVEEDEVARAGRLDMQLHAAEGREVRLENGRPYRRGEIRAQSHDEDRFVVKAHLDTIEEYLLGIREVPGSFAPAAQQAQAITARAYAYIRRGDGRYANCDCHIYDTVYDQVWYGSESEPAAWVAAVEATAGQVLLHDGRPVSTNYASSHGGHSESAQFVWGGASPHQQAVDDSRWDLASNNPYRTWELKLTPEEAGARLGVGTLLSIELPDPKGAAGRIGHPDRGYGGAIVEGTERTRELSGNQMRTMLGASQLRSSLFTVANPPAQVPVSRFDGANRYETAAGIATGSFPEGVETVYLATGGHFADALAGGPAAVADDAALLLTGPDRVPEATSDALDELDPERVVLLGGEQAIAPEVADQLEDVEVERREGEDRYATAAAIATATFEAAATTEAFVATGANFPDALAGGVVAATRDAPILLVGPDEMPASTLTALEGLDIAEVTVLGGTSAISDDVIADLEQAVAGDVIRVSGATRYETATEVADLLDATPDTAFLATGVNYPDALSAVPAAAKSGSPILLVAPTGNVPSPVEAYLREAMPEALTVLGGTSAVADEVVVDAQRASRG